jgi:RND superfamily putative drug exporter
VSVVALLLLATPALQLRIFSPDASILPQASPVRQGYDRIEQQFGPGSTSPVEVVVATPGNLSEFAAPLSAFTDELGRLPEVSSEQSLLQVLRALSPSHPFGALVPEVRSRLAAGIGSTIDHFVSPDCRTTVIDLYPRSTASAAPATRLVAAARDEAARMRGSGLEISVGGETAEGIDADRLIDDDLPRVVLLMLLVVCVTLLLAFRSPVLALKAVLMNALSLGATYGVMVLVFGHGLGARPLGFEQTGALQNFVPVLVLALLFGLGTDYEMFLLSRIRERFIATGDNTEAVATGLASTAPLISGAAALMVVVFGAFSFTGLVPIEQLGFGLAVAILLDATVVRLVLVPAAMRLMGGWNWAPLHPARERAEGPELRNLPGVALGTAADGGRSSGRTT